MFTIFILPYGKPKTIRLDRHPDGFDRPRINKTGVIKSHRILFCLVDSNLKVVIFVIVRQFKYEFHSVRTRRVIRLRYLAGLHRRLVG